MLKQLHIRDFAVVEELDLDFAPGLSVFTGETGAGKSILMEAVGLLLGDRADANVLRGGRDACEVSGSFDLAAAPGLAAWLEEQAIGAEGGELLVRRVVGRDGRSRAFLNGTPASVGMLRGAGEFLVDIHGQGEHQSLLRRETQRRILDDFGGHQRELAATAASSADWARCAAQLRELSASGTDREAQIALLRYQLDELEAERIEEGEIESLDAEHRRLANAAKLIESVQRIAAALYDDDESAQARTGRAARELGDLERLDARLGAVRPLLETALIQIDEAAGELRRYADGLEPDPGRLGAVEQRLETLHDLARKHKVAPVQLPALTRELRERLRAMDDAGARVAELRALQTQAAEHHRAAAEVLHARRVEAAARIAEQLTKQLRQLGMPNASFQVDVSPAAADAPQAHGIDQVEFLVTVNPGQPARPLGKVASGGELSRISLAIQVIGARDAGIPTLIFDEVDAGIGGATAEIVGALLHRLAAHRQVLCVTHLAQVAAQGDRHFQVEKSTTRTTTRTRVAELKEAERVEEIARMLGGLRITEQTRAHAREMLKGGKKPKAEK